MSHRVWLRFSTALETNGVRLKSLETVLEHKEKPPLHRWSGGFFLPSAGWA